MYVDSDIALAIRISLARESKSQAWLAREINVTRPYVSRLCNGFKTPSIALTKQICKVLDIRVSDFIRGGEE